MAAAAAALKFELAADLRDTLLHLRAAVRERARVAPTPALREADARAGIAELKEVLGLSRPPEVIECFDVSNISGTYAVASMVCSVGGLPARNRYRRFRIRTVTGTDDPGMMAEAVQRRFSRLQREGRPLPDLVVVDGGITQTRAARRVLDSLSLGGIPCVGLAKRFEELYWKNDAPPLSLPRDAAALKVLQRLRDEAHRVAVTYHRRLRGQAIRESRLDEIPGIGAKRKKLLLDRFGSVRRLQKAREEEIAEVPGIGSGMAHAIVEGLQTT
jgi:excinuclease ABC subunit C